MRGAVLRLVLTLALAPAPAGAAASPLPVATGAPAPETGSAFVRGSTDVTIERARAVDPGDDGVASAGRDLVVVTLRFTNDLGLDLVPRIDRFEFVDGENDVIAGLDTGFAPLVGVSNSGRVLRRDETRAYTVGFLVPSGDAGRIVYDASI